MGACPPARLPAWLLACLSQSHSFTTGQQNLGPTPRRRIPAGALAPLAPLAHALQFAADLSAHEVLDGDALHIHRQVNWWALVVGGETREGCEERILDKAPAWCQPRGQASAAAQRRQAEPLVCSAHVWSRRCDAGAGAGGAGRRLAPRLLHACWGRQVGGCCLAGAAGARAAGRRPHLLVQQQATCAC